MPATTKETLFEIRVRNWLKFPETLRNLLESAFGGIIPMLVSWPTIIKWDLQFSIMASMSSICRPLNSFIVRIFDREIEMQSTNIISLGVQFCRMSVLRSGDSIVLKFGFLSLLFLAIFFFFSLS